ncbi:protein of unknown function [Salinihabitans flavidus]|uniref:DUF4396 domain-containing protein n=1 Tax=Salinihabitans flavidus TaxID=569882 RepID=A0A1H8R0D8_9RHOB|nr:DUF4396 domain-containing protein [Salinihabitans flavidus]SEO59584.1 protein of unknown function [Salinihabitans flavidus]
METFVEFLSQPETLIVWLAVMIPSQIILWRDLRATNAHLMGLMKLVWGLTVLYSGPLGLLIYWTSGRKQIARDSLPRRAFRSVAHCYSGCGMGEVAGLIIAVGLLQLSTPWVAGITFALAYLGGFALTVGPLMQEGVALRTAIWDAIVSETPSITVMEVVAISVDLTLSGSVGMGEPLFWSAMIVSLSMGLFAAWPVNLLLIHWGVKGGMMDPRETDHAHD